MNIDFSKYSSIRIGDKFEVQILEEPCEFDGILIGGANNVLVSPKAKKLGMLGKEFDYIKILDKKQNGLFLEIGCASKSLSMYNFAKKNNLKGFEFLRNIPGTLGGILKMNAGLKDENISNYLFSIKVFKKEIFKKDISFAYRFNPIETVMFSAVFFLEFGFDMQKDEFLKNARKNQPKGASFGSIFKNPINDHAGRLIEAVGLKGFNKNDIMFSNEHANFLINKKHANFEDAIYLINLAKKKVFDEFGILLEEEVVII
ncbi:UDP-N-acetylenolpyruvoylglucosamine reductase [Campylobacter insulaenigrae]|uniref:UDP-N-acetylmuramate dehydrogenase n=1 Tax=Campylobacter insulaenigrae TaxID=260714 RepID=UPI000F6CC7CE|nr:UDP-N-acetylmuramate dehydrogenase [Campylobacter insulaenigrae]MCR6591929.1 UDP-N-acetylmuramate dehydrogenase [Campylobacter insulaenigrae]MCR6593416.1 UDP-N-acetylmuramate dehydrogenase [Campylobacter insulaenigrae]VEJ52497.1 UDP-N-acetylenolpyruvoylglucosamine reductase [Campylobacter insulaenigrae]